MTPTKILLIRRDNIGDLVCTTPMFRALRERFPAASIEAYVNSYNLPVLEGNPDLTAVHAYTKAKHRPAGTAAWPIYWQRIRQLLALRRHAFDDVIIAEPAYSPRLISLARFLAPRRIIGFAADDGNAAGLDVAIPRKSGRPLHESEDVFRLLGEYGTGVSPPPPRVFARNKPGARESTAPVIGMHISARKPSQRWPAERFVDLARQLCSDNAFQVRLFWSPGDEANALHPGDDDKAGAILAGLRDLRVQGAPTPDLRSLIDGLQECDYVVCADGGAMHLAAGLGKPIVCLFGRSDAARWYPWGVDHELLQKTGHDVADIPVDEVVAAFNRLESRIAGRSKIVAEKQK